MVSENSFKRENCSEITKEKQQPKKKKKKKKQCKRNIYILNKIKNRKTKQQKNMQNKPSMDIKFTFFRDSYDNIYKRLIDLD